MLPDGDDQTDDDENRRAFDFISLRRNFLAFQLASVRRPLGIYHERILHDEYDVAEKHLPISKTNVKAASRAMTLRSRLHRALLTALNYERCRSG